MGWATAIISETKGRKKRGQKIPVATIATGSTQERKRNQGGRMWDVLRLPGLNLSGERKGEEKRRLTISQSYGEWWYQEKKKKKKSGKSGGLRGFALLHLVENILKKKKEENLPCSATFNPLQAAEGKREKEETENPAALVQHDVLWEKGEKGRLRLLLFQDK